MHRPSIPKRCRAPTCLHKRRTIPLYPREACCSPVRERGKTSLYQGPRIAAHSFFSVCKSRGQMRQLGLFPEANLPPHDTNTLPSNPMYPSGGCGGCHRSRSQPLGYPHRGAVAGVSPPSSSAVGSATSKCQYPQPWPLSRGWLLRPCPRW